VHGIVRLLKDLRSLGPAVSVGAGAAVRAAPELSLEFLFKVEGPGYINIGNRHTVLLVGSVVDVSAMLHDAP